MIFDFSIVQKKKKDFSTWGYMNHICEHFG